MQTVVSVKKPYDLPGSISEPEVSSLSLGIIPGSLDWVCAWTRGLRCMSGSLQLDALGEEADHQRRVLVGHRHARLPPGDGL